MMNLAARTPPRLRGATALITGASGFIGTHLARRLHSAGTRLLCLDIKPPREILPAATYISADVRQLGSIELPPIDHIYNLAAVHTTPGHPDHEYYDTNVPGANEVVKLAERMNIKQITFTSSISVYGPSEEEKTEDTPPAPVSAYGKSKLMAEEIHRLWQNHSPDRKLTIVRPAVVFGRGEGGNFTRMASLLKKGIFVFPGRRDTIKSCIFVEDLIDLIAHASNTSSNYELLNGSYPDHPTLEHIVTTMRENFFPSSRLIDVPKPLVIGSAKLLSVFNGAGIGIHPDRVMKLIKSTNIYPAWAIRNGLLESADTAAGIRKWAESTQLEFN